MAAKQMMSSQSARQSIAHGLDVLANPTKVVRVALENAASVATSC